jgi:hypothetical protein
MATSSAVTAAVAGRSNPQHERLRMRLADGALVGSADLSR